MPPLLCRGGVEWLRHFAALRPRSQPGLPLNATNRVGAADLDSILTAIHVAVKKKMSHGIPPVAGQSERAVIGADWSAARSEEVMAAAGALLLA